MSQPTLLASIIAGEAAGIEPQQAVFNVMMNRAAVNFSGFGTTWISQATAAKQFSAYPDALGKPTADTYAMIAAAIDGKLGNIVPKALNYANPRLTNATWVQQANATGLGVDIGGNVFWADDKGGSPGYDPSKVWTRTTPTPEPAPAPGPVADQMVPFVIALLQLMQQYNISAKE